MSRTGLSVETESRFVVARALGEGGEMGVTANGDRVSFGVMKCSGTG